MAATTQVSASYNKRLILVPVSGAGADVPPGTILMAGVTAGTNIGVAIPVTATSNADAIGVMTDLHDYSVSGDATTATLAYWFAPFTATPPSHYVEALDTVTVVQCDYDLTTTVAVVSNTTTTIVVTSFEDDFDGGFLYVNAGSGVGQLEFVKASSSGNITIPATPGTALTNSSKLTKVLPYFHQDPVWTINTATQPTLLGSGAAAGSGRATNLGNFIVTNGLTNRLDPKAHNNQSGYNSLSQFRLYSHLGIQNTVFHPID